MHRPEKTPERRALWFAAYTAVDSEHRRRAIRKHGAREMLFILPLLMQRDDTPDDLELGTAWACMLQVACCVQHGWGSIGQTKEAFEFGEKRPSYNRLRRLIGAIKRGDHDALEVPIQWLQHHCQGRFNLDQLANLTVDEVPANDTMMALAHYNPPEVERA